MRGALWVASSAALVLSQAACLPGIAAAESVTVILGGEVAVVDGREGFAREARRAVGPTPPGHRGSDPSPPAPVDPAPQVVVVFVDARDYPEIAWELVSPWEESGIEVYGGREPSMIVIHTGPPPRVSRLRLHGATGERANLPGIRTLGPGGGGSNPKLHSTFPVVWVTSKVAAAAGSRQRSRIRVHGVSRSSR